MHTKKQHKHKQHKHKQQTTKNINLYHILHESRKSSIEKIIEKKKTLLLKDYILTYITNDKHFDFYGPDVKPLYDDLKHIGITKSIDATKNHFIGFYIPKEFYNTQFYIINMIQNLNSILDKAQLFFSMKQYFPTYYQNCIPYSFQLTLESTIEQNDIYLAKPIFSEGGIGIINVINDATLKEAKQNLKIYPEGIIMSKYITNPLLFKGKKCILDVIL